MMGLAALRSFWREDCELVSRTLLRAKGRVSGRSDYLGASVGEAIGAAIGFLGGIGLCIFMLMCGLCIGLVAVLAISVIGGGVTGLVPAGAPGAVSCANA